MQSDSLLLSTLAARAANLEGIESRMSQLDNGPSTSLHQTTAAASDPTNAGHCYCMSLVFVSVAIYSVEFVLHVENDILQSRFLHVTNHSFCNVTLAV